VTAAEQTLRREVGLTVELGDTRGNLTSVGLLLVRVLQELLGDRIGVDAGGHEVVALVAQHTDDLGGERFVEQLEDGITIRAITLGDRALLDVLPRALPQCFDVC